MSNPAARLKMKKNRKKILTMTEDQYVLNNGGDDIIGQSIFIQSHIARNDAPIEELNKKLGEICDKNNLLRAEFREKVESGEIHEDTIPEKLLSAARGHEDNEATHAARRCLQKRKIDF